MNNRQPIGRAELLAQARSALTTRQGILLSGPPGIGKSTVLQALASDPRWPVVLRVAAAEAEADLPYLALVDLFDGVREATCVALPAHLRSALDGALLRSSLPATPHDQLAVCLAVLEVLRGVALEQDVLLALDDLQWIDEPSAQVLRFVARRLGGTRVRFIAAERSSPCGTYASLCPPDTMEITVGPLSEWEIVDLVREGFTCVVGHRDAQRIYLASSGNPLYATELARAMCARSAPASFLDPLPVPERLRGLVAERIIPLPERERVALVLAAAAARPSAGLLARCGMTLDSSSQAVTGGVVTLGSDGELRFYHPLAREYVYADADQDLRRRVHTLLAEAVADPVERARHLASATDEPDLALANSLSEAANVARLRGAPAAASELAQMAAERTPEHERLLRATRWLEAAEYACAAGILSEAATCVDRVLALATEPRIRTRAWLLLVEMAGEDCSGTGPLLDAALVEAAEHPDLVARVVTKRAAKAYYDGDSVTALAELSRAEEVARARGDADLLVEILTLRGTVLVGAERDSCLEHAGEIAQGLPLTPSVVAARQAAVMSPLFQGDVETAVRRMTALRAEVERSGAVREIAGMLVSVAGVLGRAGRCDEALVAARGCARLFEDVMASPGPGLLVCAMAEFNGGCLDRATDYVERAMVACQAAGDEGWIRHALTTAGMIKLALGDPRGAVETMRPAYLVAFRLGRLDPGQVLWLADYVEALVGAGAQVEAGEVLAEVTEAVLRLGRDVAMLSLARAGALVTAAGNRARDGARALSAAIEHWACHPFPLEIARAYLVLGGLERRAHRRGAARAAFVQAAERFEAAKAVPWALAARDEVARLDSGRGQALSETEARIVELVKAGATNKEISRSLFLSVKAVEANLTRMYRRMNVRNRTQLIRILEGLPRSTR